MCLVNSSAFITMATAIGIAKEVPDLKISLDYYWDEI